MQACHQKPHLIVPKRGFYRGFWKLLGGRGVCWPETANYGPTQLVCQTGLIPMVQTQKFKVSGQEFENSQPPSSVRLRVWVR